MISNDIPNCTRVNVLIFAPSVAESLPEVMLWLVITKVQAVVPDEGRVWEVLVVMTTMATMTLWKVSCTMNLMPWMTKKGTIKDLLFVVKRPRETTP